MNDSSASEVTAYCNGQNIGKSKVIMLRVENDKGDGIHIELGTPADLYEMYLKTRSTAVPSQMKG